MTVRSLVTLGSLATCLALAETVLRLGPPLPLSGPVLTVHDPVYGKSFKRSTSGILTTPDFSTRITTNSIGFRGPEPTVFPSRCVLFLGDSFTLGFGVDDGREYPHLVGAELRRRLGPSAPPVVNAAMGDTGNARWVKFLRRDAATFDPRAVVLQVCRNDWRDNLREGQFRLDGSGRLVEQPIPPPGPARRLQGMLERIPFLMSTRLVNLAKVALHRSRNLLPADLEASGDELTTALITEALSICQRRGWPAAMVTAHVSGDRLAQVRELCERYAVRLVEPPTRADRPELCFPGNDHWSAAGHTAVADLVTQALLEPGPLRERIVGEPAASR